MPPDQSQAAQSAGQGDQAPTVAMIERLSRFDGPPDAFLANLLAVQCRIASARQGAIFQCDAEGRVRILAAYPAPEPDSAPPVWMALAAEAAGGAIASGQAAVKALHEHGQLYGEPPGRHVVLIPLGTGEQNRGAAAFVIESGDAAVIRSARQRLELTVGMLSLYDMRLALQRRQLDFQRLRAAMEILSTVNEQQRFAGAVMALCNEAASRWECQRVSLGFLEGRYVRAKAMSHTEKFSRKMKLVQAVEAAAEECLDQDVELVHPAPPDTTNVTRATTELGTRHGPHAVVSLPLRRRGSPVAVMTLERAAERPFGLAEVEAMRLTGELCTARLYSLYEHDRWFGARLAAGARKGLAALLGAKHTWLKVAAILIVAFVLYASLVDGTHRADAPFVLEASRRRLVCAPFDGDLKKVHVRPGDHVGKGKLLAELDTFSLETGLHKATTERRNYLRQANVARNEGQTTKAEEAELNAQAKLAEVELLNKQLAKARILSPIDGVVLSGDLEKRLDSPVSRQDVLFEVAPLGEIHAELLVGEDQIADVREGQTGELASKGDPKDRLAFTVVRIVPVAEVVDQKNIFRVHVKLHGRRDWLKPKTEGVAKITLGRRRLGWLWTRRLVNWIRMKLWL